MLPRQMPSSSFIQWIASSTKRKGRRKKYAHPPSIPCPYSMQELELYLNVVQEKLKRLVCFGRSSTNVSSPLLSAEPEVGFIRPDMLFVAPMDSEDDLLKAKMMKDILIKEKMISILLQKDENTPTGLDVNPALSSSLAEDETVDRPT